MSTHKWRWQTSGFPLLWVPGAGGGWCCWHWVLGHPNCPTWAPCLAERLFQAPRSCGQGWARVRNQRCGCSQRHLGSCRAPGCHRAPPVPVLSEASRAAPHAAEARPRTRNQSWNHRITHHQAGNEVVVHLIQLFYGKQEPNKMSQHFSHPSVNMSIAGDPSASLHSLLQWVTVF